MLFKILKQTSVIREDVKKFGAFIISQITKKERKNIGQLKEYVTFHIPCLRERLLSPYNISFNSLTNHLQITDVLTPLKASFLLQRSREASSLEAITPLIALAPATYITIVRVSPCLSFLFSFS